jgi:DNA invertase Pin-like site-specific DNA recombinase
MGRGLGATLLEQLSSHSSTLLSLFNEVEAHDWPARAPEINCKTTELRHQVQNRLSPEQVAELALAYQAGTTVNALARTYRINRTTVLEHLRRQGVHRRRPRRLQPVDIDKAVRLYAAEASIDSVARELRVGPTTVRRVLKQAGVDLRRRGRPSARGS